MEQIEPSCRLCEGSLEGLRKDATFCQITHRSLYHKWKDRGLTDIEIKKRYTELRSGGVITERKQPIKENKPFIKKEVSVSVPSSVPKSISPSTPNPISQQKTMKEYGISRSTLHRWSRKGLVKQYKVNGIVFYDKNDITNMITSHQIT